MDHNNNLKKNLGETEQMYVDSNGNHVTICKENSIIYTQNQNLPSHGREFGKGYNSMNSENLAWKTNVKKIYTTYGGLSSKGKGRSLSNKEPVCTVNLSAKPILPATEIYGKFMNNFNQDNWQTHENLFTNYNYHTFGNIISNGHHETIGNHRIINGNFFTQSNSQTLNEENRLPFLTDIIKELPELSINQVSEVLSSFEDDATTGQIDTPLLDSKQIYQVLSNFKPEIIPFPFQDMDLFHSNAFSLPRRNLKNSLIDATGDTYYQYVPDRTKIHYNLSLEPANELPNMTELPSCTSDQNSTLDTNNNPVGPCKSTPFDYPFPNVKEKMAHFNDQKGNIDRSDQKKIACACTLSVEMKAGQSNFRTKETSNVKQSKTKLRMSKIPIKVGKVNSNRTNDKKTCLQKGMKISHGSKQASLPGRPSSKSFITPKCYKCDKCSKTFTHLDVLTQHLHIHIKKYLNKCNVCKKAFQTKSQLNNHAKTHNKYKCKICRESFETNKKLAKHQTIHSAKGDHKCDVCEKAFKCSSHLKRHSLIHTRAKHHSDSSKSVSRKGNAKKPAKVKLCCKFCLQQFQVEKRFQNHVQKCKKK